MCRDLPLHAREETGDGALLLETQRYAGLRSQRHVLRDAAVKSVVGWRFSMCGLREGPETLWRRRASLRMVRVGAGSYRLRPGVTGLNGGMQRVGGWGRFLQVAFGHHGLN